MILSSPPGQLGNILFNMAAGYSYAIDKNINYEYVNNNIHIKKYKNNLLSNFKEHIPNTTIYNYSIYSEKNFTYSPIPDGHYTKYHLRILDGYFQSPKYFLDNLEKFKQKLYINDDIKSIAEKYISNFINPVSIHIRRTDYLKYPTIHPVVSAEYLQNAVKQFTENDITFIVFSDDIAWCKQHIEGDRIVYFDLKYEGNDYPPEVLDLIVMSLCKGNIIANSTFSWWAAMLGNLDKKVVAPKLWFGPDGPKNWQDIYMENWIKL